ncbi:hypothetical protein [Halobaculum marinum]|uniref:Uncharacterized protein n=1 Tax=Halobaculum marinum TaxID=3031996 RepID=A0ABD5WV24_9EURY|nr:hypothetical protein [Halobaculum sp. DT55]
MTPDSDGPDRPLPIEELLDTPDQSLVYELKLEPNSGLPRKLAIEPATDGEKWTLHEFEYNGCIWRQVGSEQLDEFSTQVTAEG